MKLEVEGAAGPRLVRQRRRIVGQGQPGDIRIAGTRRVGVEEERWLVVPNVVIRAKITRVCTDLLLFTERRLVTISFSSMSMEHISIRRYKHNAANDRHNGQERERDAQL